MLIDAKYHSWSRGPEKTQKCSGPSLVDFGSSFCNPSGSDSRLKLFSSLVSKALLKVVKSK